MALLHILELKYVHQQQCYIALNAFIEIGIFSDEKCKLLVDLQAKGQYSCS
jgi:hypothetical protein